jgi:release factor glutamine methyltransferase
MKIAEALGQGSLEKSERRLFLGQILGQSHAWIAAHDEVLLQQEQIQQFHQWVARRVAGEPVAYILGWKEFYGRPFTVSPQVLIPRPDTETLVDWAMQILSSMPSPALLDLGCGSGALAITLAAEWPKARVSAVDISAGALVVAEQNARALLGPSAGVVFLQGSWYAPVLGQRFDVIVSNPPYVAEQDPHLDQGDVRFEPRGALVGGRDGLADLRQVIAKACMHLKPGGWLLVEHGYDQAQPVADLFAEAGFLGVESRRDLAGQPRCTGGFCP